MFLGRLLAWFRRPRRKAYVEVPPTHASPVDSAWPPVHPKTFTDPLAESARIYPPAPPSKLPPLEPLVPLSSLPSQALDSWVIEQEEVPPQAPAPSTADPRDAGAGLLKMVMADGSVAAPSLDAELERQVAYITREILTPDPKAEAALAGPGQLKVILEDGSVVTPEDPDLQSQIQYLAKEILSSEDSPGGPA